MTLKAEIAALHQRVDQVADLVEDELAVRRRERTDREAAAAEEKARNRIGHQVEPGQPRATAALLAAPTIIGEHFKTVPERFYERHDRDVVVHCPCGGDVELGFAALRTCHGCMRTYFNGLEVHAAPPPEDDDVYLCDGCSGDLRAADGTWIRIDADELFVCEGCLAIAPEGSDLLSAPELLVEEAA